MNKFIKTVSDDLETMVKIRQEYIDREDDLLRNCDDRIHQRIFEIYSKDTPEVLVRILHKPRLIDEEEDDSQHNVGSVLKYFWQSEATDRIVSAYWTYHQVENAQELVDELDRLTLEMQDCFNNLQMSS